MPVGGEDAFDWLVEAARSVGLDVLRDETGVYVAPHGGPRVSIRLARVGALSARHVAAVVSDGGAGEIRVVVGDGITRGARDALRNAGWGWLDLRGHLRISGPGIVVDTAITLHRNITRASDPFSGRVGIEVATAILLQPYSRIGIREVASRIGRAPSAVWRVIDRLRDAGMITAEDKPKCPELFGELAAMWRPIRVAIKALPTEEQADELRTWRWALTGKRAAAAYGAPIVPTGPPELHVPDGHTLRSAVRQLGACRKGERCAAVLVESPVSNSRNIVSDNLSSGPWALAEPLLVALTLAQDPAVLDRWSSPEECVGVW